MYNIIYKQIMRYKCPSTALPLLWHQSNSSRIRLHERQMIIVPLQIEEEGKAKILDETSANMFRIYSAFINLRVTGETVVKSIAVYKYCS